MTDKQWKKFIKATVVMVSVLFWYFWSLDKPVSASTFIAPLFWIMLYSWTE